MKKNLFLASMTLTQLTQNTIKIKYFELKVLTKVPKQTLGSKKSYKK
jgi:hypothetical protein